MRALQRENTPCRSNGLCVCHQSKQLSSCCTVLQPLSLMPAPQPFLPHTHLWLSIQAPAAHVVQVTTAAAAMRGTKHSPSALQRPPAGATRQMGAAAAWGGAPPPVLVSWATDIARIKGGMSAPRREEPQQQSTLLTAACDSVCFLDQASKQPSAAAHTARSQQRQPRPTHRVTAAS